MSQNPREWSAWRFITWFGVVSLLADFVYEGARSVVGPYLGGLGASAAFIGIVTGLGEAFALSGRLGTGPLADKTRAYWPLTITGYAVTIVAVPLLGLSSVLLIAALLVIAERAGKALRSPAKDVMLSHATAGVGRGKGFALHEAMDQIGAVLGPLTVAAVLATTKSYTWAFGLLAIPGIAVLGMLFWLKKRVPKPELYERDHPHESSHAAVAPSFWRRFPHTFWWYMGFTFITTAGYATFGVISFHLSKQHVIAAATIPVVYAGAMGIDAIAALAAGWFYDRIGRGSLVAVPFMAAIIPVLAFTFSPWLAITGVLLWGAVMGLQESTMRAAVAELVPSGSRGTAYGVFAAGFGAATFIGGVLAGALYDVSISLLITVTLCIQVVALAVFTVAARKT